jgi:hypothetical protein
LPFMPSFRLRGAIITALALAAPIASARAASVSLADPVPGHAGMTYLDLLRQAAPDLRESDRDAQGHLAAPLRHLAVKDFGGDLPDPVTVSQLEAVRIEVGGRPRLVVMADLGPSETSVQSNTLLALFDDAPKPRLLDVAAVGLDRLTSFGTPEKLRIGPGDEALITYSEHFNTSETYAGQLVIFVLNGRLTRLLQLFNLSDRECGWERTEAPSFASRPDPGRRYWRVEVTVREVMKVDRSAGCGEERMPRPYVRSWRATYRWDGARRRYVTVSTTLNRLDRLHRARF